MLLAVRPSYDVKIQKCGSRKKVGTSSHSWLAYTLHSPSVFSSLCLSVCHGCQQCVQMREDCSKRCPGRSIRTDDEQQCLSTIFVRVFLSDSYHYKWYTIIWCSLRWFAVDFFSIEVFIRILLSLAYLRNVTSYRFRKHWTNSQMSAIGDCTTTRLYSSCLSMR